MKKLGIELFLLVLILCGCQSDDKISNDSSNLHIQESTSQNTEVNGTDSEDALQDMQKDSIAFSWEAELTKNNIESNYTIGGKWIAYDINGNKICDASGNVREIPSIEINDMADKAKQESLNSLIEAECLKGLSVLSTWMHNAEIKITYQSDKFLGFEYIINEMPTEYYDFNNRQITIDLVNMKRVTAVKDSTSHNDLYEKLEEWQDKTVEEQSDLLGMCGYEVYEAETQYAGIPYTYAQIRGMDNQSNQEKANKILKESMADIIDITDTYQEWISRTKVHLYYKSDKWLSINYLIKGDVGDYRMNDSMIDICITIDLETGERVMLDDLLEIDKNFVNWYAINLEKSWQNAATVKSLRESCMTEKEYLEDCNSTTLSLLLDKKSFYLIGGMLVIREKHSFDDYEILLPELYEFLKTEPWY